jgi:hypothetical protein
MKLRKSKKKPFDIAETKAVNCMGKGCHNQVIAAPQAPLILCEGCKRKLAGQEPKDRTLI